jgi:uncharacterized protein (DUF305 family)
MTKPCSPLPLRRSLFACLLLSSPLLPAPLQAQGEAPRTVQPGAPGQANRTLSAADLARQEHPRHTAQDVSFMQGMLLHHAQAIVMADLSRTRTQNADIRRLARRIELSQDDEIGLMSRWLIDRSETVPQLVLRYGGDPVDVTRGRVAATGHAGHEGHGAPAAAVDPHAGHGAPVDPHAGHGAPAAPDPHAGHDSGSSMHGMLTNEELAQLAASSGREFDRLFLRFMIRHHEGAVTMVQELFGSPSSGQEEDIFTFASHVEGDQNIEILRMRGMLNALR